MTISHTKEFFMLALNEKGKIPAMKSIEIYGCLLASGLMELMNHELVVKDEKGRFTVTEKDFDSELSYSICLYQNAVRLFRGFLILFGHHPLS